MVVLGKHYPKHLKLAQRIIEELRPEHDVEIHIIGPMRNGEEKVAQFYNEMNLAEDIRERLVIHGTTPLAKLPALLQNCHILLHVKVGDWCPNAVVEALACGLPVVCPSWGGTAELVGEAGISIDGPEWGVNEELAVKMSEAVLEVSKDLERYSNLARKRAEEKFNIEDVSRRYLEVLGYQS